MKQYVLSMLVVLLGVFGFNSLAAQNERQAKIEAPVLEHDFGTFKESDGSVTHVFEVKNVGDAPLVITRVLSSCGCTTPSFSTEPIAPGKSGQITVTYNPEGRVYPFVKTISVYSNGKQGPLVLTIKGEVIK